jgi:hypothetical protein
VSWSSNRDIGPAWPLNGAKESPAEILQRLEIWTIRSYSRCLLKRDTAGSIYDLNA